MLKNICSKVDIKQPKAKKDLYGKDKTEGVTFEAYAQRMDMIAEGTWSLPENEAEAMKLAAMMGQPIALGDGGDDATNALGGLLGDDELFDDLGVAGDKDPEGDARPIIIGWMMDHVDDYDQKFQETMKMALDKIRADGNDSEMVIPRMFGNPRNTSATQGERMGSNADDVKANEAEIDEDPNEGNEFSGALAKAKEEGKDEFEVDGKKYKVKEAEIEEGRMSDLHQHIGEMIADGASNEEIKKMHPGVSDRDINSIRREMDESVQFEEVQEVDEVAESIAKMKAMAGVGSTAKSNHGIHEGEEGYQITPRSIVAREMRKLQDIERG